MLKMSLKLLYVCKVNIAAETTTTNMTANCQPNVTKVTHTHTHIYVLTESFNENPNRRDTKKEEKKQC